MAFTRADFKKSIRMKDLDLHRTQVVNAKARYNKAVLSSVDDATVVTKYRKRLIKAKARCPDGESPEIDAILADEALILSEGTAYYNKEKATNKTLYDQAFGHIIAMKDEVIPVENTSYNAIEKQDYINIHNEMNTLING